MLPPDFWEKEKAFLLALLFPGIEELAIAGAVAGARKLREVGFEFDDTLANATAARWAREKAGQLIELLTGTSQKVVGEIVATWVETPGATIGDLADRLKPVVANNADRALMVAVTETTNAYANGEAIIYQQAGIPRAVFLPAAHPRCRCWTKAVRLKNGQWVVVWMTNRDEIVCRTPIRTPWGEVEGCRKLHNVVLSEGPYLGQKVTDID